MAISRAGWRLCVKPLHCKILILASVFSLFLDRNASTIFIMRGAPVAVRHPLQILCLIPFGLHSRSGPFFILSLHFSCVCTEGLATKILLLASGKRKTVATDCIKASFGSCRLFIGIVPLTSGKLIADENATYVFSCPGIQNPLFFIARNRIFETCHFFSEQLTFRNRTSPEKKPWGHMGDKIPFSGNFGVMSEITLGYTMAPASCACIALLGQCLPKYLRQ